MKDKLMITLALLGNVPTKKLNPSTPITPIEIADTLEECGKLGVTIAHLHARDKNEEPTHDRASYKAILDEIHKRNLDIITQVSTGARGGPNTIESRGQMLDLDCDMGSLATGSSNFPTTVNANNPDLIAALAKKMYENNIKPEIEAFDVGMISYAKFLLKKGILKAPLHFNLVMNVPGSIEGTPKNLMHMIEYLPPNSTWSVCGIGNSQVDMLTMAIIMGGHVRTGLEDTMIYSKGIPATNKMLVERIVRIANELGREIATTTEAREILGLKTKVKI
ncbi:MAG: 3-keto-5-aminohexanoate cleavage protein [Promethearchaeota archaeon]